MEEGPRTPNSRMNLTPERRAEDRFGTSEKIAPEQLYGVVDYNANENRSADISVLNDGEEGVALRPVKDKWNELGPLKLEEIMECSEIKID